MSEWCPTQGGTFTAYAPQWWDGEKWCAVPYNIAKEGEGVGYPRITGGICQTIGLCGMAQANALAWAFAADAEVHGKTIKVRATPYEVVYDIKARAMELEPPAA